MFVFLCRISQLLGCTLEFLSHMSKFLGCMLQFLNRMLEFVGLMLQFLGHIRISEPCVKIYMSFSPLAWSSFWGIRQEVSAMSSLGFVTASEPSVGMYGACVWLSAQYFSIFCYKYELHICFNFLNSSTHPAAY